MATIEQKADGKTSPDQIKTNGFDLENAPIRRPLSAEALARRIANNEVEEIEDPDEE